MAQRDQRENHYQYGQRPLVELMSAQLPLASVATAETREWMSDCANQHLPAEANLRAVAAQA